MCARARVCKGGGWGYAASQTTMLHMKRLNKTESPIFEIFVCSLFPNAILFYFYDKKSVSEAVEKCVTVINEVATPLFKKKTNRIEGSFMAKYSLRANWFDDECREKKQNYTEALSLTCTKF